MTYMSDDLFSEIESVGGRDEITYEHMRAWSMTHDMHTRNTKHGLTSFKHEHMEHGA